MAQKWSGRTDFPHISKAVPLSFPGARLADDRVRCAQVVGHRRARSLGTAGASAAQASGLSRGRISK